MCAHVVVIEQYLAGWVIRINPQVVQHLVLVDPVCFVATFPETCYTVLYKPSVTTEDRLLAYFLRADLTLSHTLHRTTAWYNIYFSFDYIPDDIAVTVGLASGDILLSFAALDKMSDMFIEKRNRKTATSVDTVAPTVGKAGGRHAVTVAQCSKLVWDIPHAEAMTSDTCIAEIKLKLFEYDTSDSGVAMTSSRPTGGDPSSLSQGCTASRHSNKSMDDSDSSSSHSHSHSHRVMDASSDIALKSPLLK